MDKIFSPIKGRIIEYIEYKGIKKEDFYEKTSISPSNFKGKGAESEIGGDKIVKILTEYSELNPEWLILGVGNMVRNKTSSKAEAKEDVVNTEISISNSASMDFELKQMKIMIHTIYRLMPSALSTSLDRTLTEATNLLHMTTVAVQQELEGKGIASADK